MAQRARCGRGCKTLEAKKSPESAVELIQSNLAAQCARRGRDFKDLWIQSNQTAQCARRGRVFKEGVRCLAQ